MPRGGSAERLRDEASARFMGHGSVVGVATGTDDGITVMLAAPDGACEAPIRAWARERSVDVRFMVVGNFVAGAA